MRFSEKARTTCWFFYCTLFIILGSVFAGTNRAEAQCNTGSALQGFNGVYGNCNGTATQQGTFAMVDASQYQSTGNICLAIQAIFNAYSSSTSGITVDARGFNPGQSQPCSENPWNVGTQPKSSVLLLPSGIITISKTWILPTNARVIGEGPNLTILRAASGFSLTYTEMIDMSASGCGGNNDCPAIAVEHLGLDGNSQSIGGIVNKFSQELGYVNDVAFSNMTGANGVALTVTTNGAANSGPYSNLTMSNVGTCIKMSGGSPALTDTRGVHGLTCATDGSSAAAIYLDSPNNSLEDVYISGTSSQDGILIGSQSAAQNNILFNIRGSGLGNVIHISPSNSTTQTNCPAKSKGGTTVYNVCNLTILGVTNSLGTNTTIKDELTTPTTTLADQYVGMYIVGEPVQKGSSGTNDTFLGHARFTTSPSVPTWLVGTANPPSNPCAVGSIYSETTGSASSYSLYKCVGPIGSTAWVAVK